MELFPKLDIVKTLILNNLMQIPKYYQKYLKERSDNLLINGLPLYGFENEGENLITANNLFELMRPDISAEHLVIRFSDVSALLIKRTGESDEMYQINLLDINARIQNLDISFRDYVLKSQLWCENRKKILDQIKKQKITSEYNRKECKKKGPPKVKSRNWRVVRSAVHDYIVALVAFRYNEKFNSMEVSAFLVTDHPNYEQGHGIKAALNLLFSAAYKCGSLLEIKFVSDKKGTSENIPKIIIEFASTLGINILEIESIITHEIGLRLYTHISSLETNIEEIYNQTKKKNNFSLQGLCFLANLRIWELHEIKYVLSNSQNPEGLLFGKDMPENWNSFEVSIHLGRNIIATTNFLKSIEILLESINGKSFIDISNNNFILKVTHQIQINTINTKSTFIEADLEYILIPRIRKIYLKQDIFDDLEYMNKLINEYSKIVVIYSQEMNQNEELINILNNQTDYIVIVLPIQLNELDDEVLKRMKKVKTLRK